MSLALTIGGVSVVPHLEHRTLQWETAKNGQPDMLVFSLTSLPADALSVAVDEEVIFTTEGVTRFKGRVLRVNTRVESVEIIRRDIECQDYTRDANKGELIAEIYENETAEDIIADLLARYSQLSAFTDNNVSCPETIEYLFLDYVTFSQVLRTLSDRTGYDFYIDKDKDIHFTLPGTDTAPFDPTDTSGTMIRESLELKEDGSEIINSVSIEGGEYDASETDTDSFTATASQTEFNLSGRFSSVAVTDNGSAQTVGIYGIHDAAAFDCLHDFSGKKVIFATGRTAGHTIEVSGKQKLPVQVQAEDGSSIAAHGVLALFEKDASLKTVDSATQYAFSLLGKYAEAQSSASFQTLQAGIRAGQKITVTHSVLGISEEYYVQRTRARVHAGETLVTDVDCAKAEVIDAVGLITRIIKKQNQSSSADAILNLVRRYAEICGVADVLENTENKSITWVLAPYFPSTHADPQRVPLLDWNGATLL